MMGHAMHAGAEAPLLSDVSLSLPAKQLGLIYGRSGAGKTTLLQLLAGLQQPTSGTIAVIEGAGGSISLPCRHQQCMYALCFTPVCENNMLVRQGPCSIQSPPDRPGFHLLWQATMADSRQWR